LIKALRWQLEVPSGVADMAEGCRTHQHERRKRELIGGAHMEVVGERKDVTAGIDKPKEKASFW
jgi:hypothetical protein